MYVYKETICYVSGETIKINPTNSSCPKASTYRSRRSLAAIDDKYKKRPSALRKYVAS